jgi:hypothetical protein
LLRFGSIRSIGSKRSKTSESINFKNLHHYFLKFCLCGHANCLNKVNGSIIMKIEIYCIESFLERIKIFLRLSLKNLYNKIKKIQLSNMRHFIFMR